MSEGVWADCFLHANGFGQCLNDMKNCYSRDLLSSFADKNIVFIVLLDRNLISVKKVKLKLPNGSRRDGNQALFATLPFDFDEAYFQIEIR